MSLYLQTLRHLKPVQVYSRLRRGVRWNARGAPSVQLRDWSGLWTPSIWRPVARTSSRRVRLLNQEREFRSWNDAGVPKLWLYHLHSFERPEQDWMEDWITANPRGTGNGWEPYPLSRRLVNWIRWLAEGGTATPSILTSLAEQAEYLSRNLEFHLLANHLLVNAKALAFAGCWFEGHAAERWLKRARLLLEREIGEQLLADGGHFERSPMYHSLVLEDLLDLVNLNRACPGLLPDWRVKAGHMLGWLRKMCHPDGRIAFFNDAAFGVAAEPAELEAYAAWLGVEAEPVELGESGYVRLEAGRTVALFDAAAVGPDYQPGHAHADTLSFELSHAGQRVFVNSGTSTYEEGAEREFERSTAAHNALRVDGMNQSEVWKAFRVGRRSRVGGIETAGARRVSAWHDGYERLKEPVRHWRSLEIDDGRAVVVDRLEGKGEHTIEIFFHMAPGSGSKIELDPKLCRRDEAGSWRPEFNRTVENRRVCGLWRGRLPVQFVTRLEFGDGGSGADGEK